jgi:DNA-binding NarL/FixJ family response regulator
MQSTNAFRCYVYSKFFFISQGMAAQLNSVGVNSNPIILSHSSGLSERIGDNDVLLVDCTNFDPGQVHRQVFPNDLLRFKAAGLILPENRLLCRELVARGFLAVGFSTWPIERIARLVEAAAMGDGTVPSDIFMNTQNLAQTSRFDVQPRSCSGIETSIVELIAQGFSNKSIGRKLGLSEAMVKMHVHRLMRSFNALNRTALAISAMRSGVISEMVLT